MAYVFGAMAGALILGVSFLKKEIILITNHVL